MNIELFIALVKDRPVLYDLRNPLYKDIRQKEKKWREISTAMDIHIEVAQSKWRNLKDCFIKHLKGTKTTTGGAASKYHHWQWAKHMEFMKPHLSISSTITKVEQQSSSDAQGTKPSSVAQGTQSSSVAQGTQSRSNAQGSKPSSDTQGTQLSLSLQGTVRSHGTSQRKRQISSDTEVTFSNSDRVIQYLENQKSNFDATELIFIGYAKTIKQFSIQRQARIKMDIAKMLAEEEVAHYEETMLRYKQTSRNDSPLPIVKTSRSSISPDHNA